MEYDRAGCYSVQMEQAEWWPSGRGQDQERHRSCLLYTSDAADERSSVDLGGRRIIKKKKIREAGGEIDVKNKMKVDEQTTEGTDGDR